MAALYHHYMYIYIYHHYMYNVDSLGVRSLVVGVGILLGEGRTCLLLVKSAIASSFGKLEEVFAVGGLLLEGGGLLLLLLVLSDEK